MTPKLLLLVLAVTASLIATQVHCGDYGSSGDAETETNYTEEDTSDTSTVSNIHAETVPPVHVQREEVVTRPVTKVSKPQSYPNLGSPQTTVTVQRLNTTQTQSTARNVKTTTGTSEPTTVSNWDSQTDDFSTIVIALVLALILIVILVAAILICRRKSAIAAAEKEDPYLDAEGKEKVPMPMFEEDVPSVLELEMEDLEKWMIKGDEGISMDSRQN